ncbi:hypothetical protein FMM74_019305 [Lachnospiraceae bacterium MD308]|nr:hypothetical protein [Lachnospiraceae bacterium MD308]
MLTDRLILNPDISVDEQAAVINQMIADSGMEKQLSSCISRTYNVDQLYQMALELRQNIECALWPYIDLKTCLVFDLDNLDAEPVTYNILTRQICRNGIWENQELDLPWKFIFYPNTKIHPSNALFKEEKEKNDYGYLYGKKEMLTCQLRKWRRSTAYGSVFTGKLILSTAATSVNGKKLAYATFLTGNFQMRKSFLTYNVTLDLVIDEIERRIQDNRIVTASEPVGNPRVVIITEDGIVSTVLASDPDIQIDIIELDRNYADSELRSSTYDAALKEPGLQNCSYSLHVPDYEQEMEVDE